MTTQPQDVEGERTVTTAPDRWRNRVVKRGSADPRTLRANSLNWRVHPPEQRAALIEVLDKVGWVREAAIVNQTTGNMIDGHLRVDVAIERGEKRVPTQYVELSEDEERLVLATLDSITGMAEVDTETLDALLATLSPDSGSAIDALLAELATTNGIAAPLFEPVPDGAQSRLDQKAQVRCPECGHEFVP